MSVRGAAASNSIKQRDLNSTAPLYDAFENRLRAGLSCEQIQPLSRIIALNGQKVREIRPVGEGKRLDNTGAKLAWKLERPRTHDLSLTSMYYSIANGNGWLE